MIILPERALQFGYLEPVGEIAKSTSPKGPKDSAQGFNHTGETPMLPWARRRAGPRELEAVFATAAAGGRAKSSIGVPPVFRNEAANLGCDVENSSAMQTPAPENSAAVFEKQ